MFDYCGSCQPGRLYCGEACSGAAREESTRTARAKYNDRDSEEGREAHRIEEADRRARERVGDHRLQDQTGRLEVRAAAAYQASAKASDAAPISPAAQPTPTVLEITHSRTALGSLEPRGLGAEPPAGAPNPAPAEWILVAWPGSLRAARRRLGTEASCPFCGRRGRIARVVSLAQWRRRVRRGFR